MFEVKQYVFSGASKGLVPVSSKDKDDLPVGTILQLNGYCDPKYVIVENLGVGDLRYQNCSRYKVVDLETKLIQFKDAYELEFIADKKDGRIQTYILDKKISQEEVEKIKKEAEELESKRIKKNEEQLIEKNKQIEIGKKIAIESGIENAASLIVAEHEIDESDIMTDYFHVSTGELIVLAISNTKRVNFKEMRKAAAKFEETKHLAVAPLVNNNNASLTEENKSWWHPKDEHREGYSGGSGYYLKTEGPYSTGWAVRKITRGSYSWQDKVYLALAKKGGLV